MDSEKRANATKALGELGDEMAIEPLVNALKDDNDDVRYSAALALDKLYFTPKNEKENA